MMLQIATEYMSFNESTGLYVTKATNKDYQINLRQ